MGNHSSCTKNQEWALVQAKCWNASTFPVQVATSELKLPAKSYQISLHHCLWFCFVTRVAQWWRKLQTKRTSYLVTKPLQQLKFARFCMQVLNTYGNFVGVFRPFGLGLRLHTLLITPCLLKKLKVEWPFLSK